MLALKTMDSQGKKIGKPNFPGIIPTLLIKES